MDIFSNFKFYNEIDFVNKAYLVINLLLAKLDIKSRNRFIKN